MRKDQPFTRSATKTFYEFFLPTYGLALYLGAMEIVEAFDALGVPEYAPNGENTKTCAERYGRSRLVSLGLIGPW